MARTQTVSDACRICRHVSRQRWYASTCPQHKQTNLACMERMLMHGTHDPKSMISFAILLPTVTDQPAASLVGMTSHNLAETLGRIEQAQTKINDKTKIFWYNVKLKRCQKKYFKSKYTNLFCFL